MQIIDNLERRVWQNPTPRWYERSLRILLAVFRVVTKSQIKLFATALTYHTLLAIVPLLAVLFTLLKSFGIESYLKGLIDDMLKPMGSAGDQVGDYLFQFINNAQAGLLGGVGILFLFYTIFNLFNKIEISLNHLWNIESSRDFKNQLMSYLGVIMLAVIVATLALGLNLFGHQDILQQRWQHLLIVAMLLTWGVKMLSIAATAVMLAVLYSGAVNTDVNFRAAFVGGLFCAVLWVPLTTGFTALIAMSTSYSVIYSSFAGLVILLIWLNILWLLFLSGGLVAYFVQFPALLRPYASVRLNPAEMEHYAEVILQLITARFNAGKGATELAELISHSGLSHRQVLNLLAPFLQQHLVIAVGRNQTGYLPAVNPEQLDNDTVRNTIRGNIRHQKISSATALPLSSTSR